MEFLSKECPEVPESQRQALIYGATTAAQSVTRLHVLCDGARTGNDKTSKSTAEAAQRSLSFYNFGLMSRNHNDPLPQVANMPSVPITTATSEMVTATITTDGIPPINVPMSRQELDHMQEDMEDDGSEDELGLTTPSIEIVEDQPRSAQRPPDPNHQSKKKRRKRRPEKEPQASPEPEANKRPMNLEERNQHMIQEPELNDQASVTLDSGRRHHSLRGETSRSTSTSQHATRNRDTERLSRHTGVCSRTCWTIVQCDIPAIGS